jgi:hypothetical protein
MHPDNTAAIVLAARQRHELTRAKAIRALRELDHDGASVTFQAVARTAGVSRSWLYGQPDLRAEIQRLRQATLRAPTPPLPARQRASDASLLARLQAALDNNRKLVEDNQRWRPASGGKADRRGPPDDGILRGGGDRLVDHLLEL